MTDELQLMLPLPLIQEGNWIPIKDGDPGGRALYDRHYSSRAYADGRQPKLFVGPGYKLVLTTANRKALFVWRKFISMDDQEGVNCAVFRNEGCGVLSSVLIKEAMQLAWLRWPGERLYTYVHPGKVKSANPGYCFKMAGWTTCGASKGGLVILEVFPAP